jgi:hypothetical protein
MLAILLASATTTTLSLDLAEHVFQITAPRCEIGFVSAGVNPGPNVTFEPTR